MEDKVQRNLWITVAIIVIIFLVAYAFFAIKKHEQNKASQANQSVISTTIKHQQYTQYNAAAGGVIGGFPNNILPADASVTNSYNNKYNGLEQYTVNATIGQPMAVVYVDYQRTIQDAGYTLGKTTSSDNVDTINATQGNNYVTIQLTPQNSTGTNIVANYGVPSAATTAPVATTPPATTSSAATSASASTSTTKSK
jgi:hypothetical protein